MGGPRTASGRGPKTEDGRRQSGDARRGRAGGADRAVRLRRWFGAGVGPLARRRGRWLGRFGCVGGSEPGSAYSHGSAGRWLGGAGGSAERVARRSGWLGGAGGSAERVARRSGWLGGAGGSGVLVTRVAWLCGGVMGTGGSEGWRATRPGSVVRGMVWSGDRGRWVGRGGHLVEGGVGLIEGVDGACDMRRRRYVGFAFGGWWGCAKE
jgi:hypothetical protein